MRGPRGYSGGLWGSGAAASCPFPHRSEHEVVVCDETLTSPTTHVWVFFRL